MRVGIAYVDVRVRTAQLDRDLAAAQAKVTASATKMQSTLNITGTRVRTLGVETKKTGKSLDKMAESTGKAKRGMLGLLPHVAAVTASYMAMRAALRATVAAFSAGSEFDEAMSFVKAISRATAEDFERLGEAAKKAGLLTKFSAVEAAEALKFLSQAGFEVNEQIAALPGTLRLAMLGSLELGRATDIATDIMNAFKIEATELETVVDRLVATTTRTNTNIEQLGQFMKFAAPIAGALGKSLEEILAAGGILAQSGLKGGVAGRGMQQGLIRALKAAKELGLESNDLIDIMKRLRAEESLLADAIGEKAAADEIALKIQKQFGLIALKTILVLKENVVGYEVLLDAIRRSAGESKTSADIIESSMTNTIEKLGSALRGVSIEAFGLYDKTLKSTLTGATSFINEHSSALTMMIANLAGLIKVVIQITAIWGAYKLAVWAATAATGKFMLVLNKLGPAIVFLASFKAATWLFEWADGTRKLRKETEQAVKQLDRLNRQLEKRQKEDEAQRKLDLESRFKWEEMLLKDQVKQEQDAAEDKAASQQLFIDSVLGAIAILEEEGKVAEEAAKVQLKAMKKVENEIEKMRKKSLKHAVGKGEAEIDALMKWQKKAKAIYAKEGKDEIAIIEVVASEYDRITEEMIMIADKAAAKQIKIAETLRKELLRNQSLAIDAYKELYEITGLEKYLNFAIEANEMILDSEIAKLRKINISEDDANTLRISRAEKFRNEMIAITQGQADAQTAIIVDAAEKQAQALSYVGGAFNETFPGSGVGRFTGLPVGAASLVTTTRIPIETEEYYNNAIELAEELLKTQKEALEKQLDLVKALGGAYTSIDDLVNSLVFGDLAPVQSYESFSERFTKVMEEASAAISSGNADRISRAMGDLTSFIPKFVEFASIYSGSDVNQVFNSIVDMLNALKEAALVEGIRELGVVVDQTSLSVHDLAKLLGIGADSLIGIFDFLSSENGPISLFASNLAGALETVASNFVATAAAIAAGEYTGTLPIGGTSGGSGGLPATGPGIGEGEWVRGYSIDPTLNSWDWTGTSVNEAIIAISDKLPGFGGDVPTKVGDQWWIPKWFAPEPFNRWYNPITGEDRVNKPTAAYGGLFDEPYIGGEAGREWAVPATEPYSSSFLRDVGADPEVTGNAIAEKIGPMLASMNSEGGEIHVHVHIDGHEIGSVVADQSYKHSDMMNGLRSNM